MHATTAPALLLDVDFGCNGASGDYVLDGWGPPEPGHRWSVGAESRLRLPGGAGNVMAIHVIPLVRLPDLPAQTVLVGVDGLLVAQLVVRTESVFAMRLPERDSERVVSFGHVEGARPRDFGVDDQGSPLNLMVLSVRLYGMDDLGERQRLYPQETAALDVRALAAGFESLGHGCEFGLVQRKCGVETLGLLRFSDTGTARLAHGLVRRFEGIGEGGTVGPFLSRERVQEFCAHDQLYGLWYRTRQFGDETMPEGALRAALDRVRTDFEMKLPLLRRKFVDDLQDGEKIFVLTRRETLSEPEALAVHAALQIEGPNTLLWTVNDGSAPAGTVDRLAPGFLRGHLGERDADGYARLEVWVSVMAGARGLASR